MNCTLEIPASALGEREEIEILLNRLQRASVSFLYASQERGTVHVLERGDPQRLVTEPCLPRESSTHVIGLGRA